MYICMYIVTIAWDAVVQLRLRAADRRIWPPTRHPFRTNLKWQLSVQTCCHTGRGFVGEKEKTLESSNSQGPPRLCSQNALNIAELKSLQWTRQARTPPRPNSLSCSNIEQSGWREAPARGGGNRSSASTCLTHFVFKSGEKCGKSCWALTRKTYIKIIEALFDN